MSGGGQAMVSIGRELMAELKLLVIDEIISRVVAAVCEREFQGHHADQCIGHCYLAGRAKCAKTLAISHYGYVLSQGRVVAQGTAQALASNDEVRSVYVG